MGPCTEKFWIRILENTIRVRETGSDNSGLSGQWTESVVTITTRQRFRFEKNKVHRQQ